MPTEKMLVFRCVDSNINENINIIVIRESDGVISQCLSVYNPYNIGEAEQILARRVNFGDLVCVSKGDPRLIAALEKTDSNDFFKPYLERAKMQPRSVSHINLEATIQNIVGHNVLSIDEEKVLRYKIQHDPDFIFAACGHFGVEAIKKELEADE